MGGADSLDADPFAFTSFIGSLASAPDGWFGLPCVRNQAQPCIRISSYSELRRNLAAAIDRVNADREPLIITRDRGKPMAVLMSLEDFASYEETLSATQRQERGEAP
jgi:prevent-host-death family protein